MYIHTYNIYVCTNQIRYFINELYELFCLLDMGRYVYVCINVFEYTYVTDTALKFEKSESI